MENHECFSISEATEIQHVGVGIDMWNRPFIFCH